MSMRRYFFLYAIVSILLVPRLYAMEKEKPVSPITSDVFTVESKQYMQRIVASWAQTARVIRRTQAGLGAAFDNIDYAGIEHLVSDPAALERANRLYIKIMADKSKNPAEIFAFLDMRPGEQTGPIMITEKKSSSETAEQTAKLKAQLLVRAYCEQIRIAKKVQEDQADDDCICVVF